MMRKIIDKIAIGFNPSKIELWRHWKRLWGILGRLGETWVRLGHAVYLAGIKFTLVQFVLVLV